MAERLTLRLPREAIRTLAERYPPSKLETEIVNTVSPRTRAAGFYTRDDFLMVCYWKSPRTKPQCEKNDEATIRAVTEFAFSTPIERLRIEALTLLLGVGWPTASALLHLGHRDRYPILDFRALWSLSIDAQALWYDFGLWKAYTDFCRQLADEDGLSMRELDRALWQYSIEKQDKQ